MTVKQLRKLLSSYPDDMEVLSTDFDDNYYSFNLAQIRKVKDGLEMGEGEGDDSDKVLCLI
jgi:hypothetical protein